MMTDQWQEVAQLYFRGDQFQDHALDLSALSEIQHFQKMVNMTAESLWKRNHGDKKRIPKDFYKNTRMYLRTIKPGSVEIPVEIDNRRQYQFEDILPLYETIKEIIDLIHQTFEAAENHKSLPEKITRKLLPVYAKWGSRLSDDGILEFSSIDKRIISITNNERQYLKELSNKLYEDEVTISGHIFEVDMMHERFKIVDHNKEKIPVQFTDQRKTQIINALKEHNSKQLRIRGCGEFNSQGKLVKIISISDLDFVVDEETIFDSTVSRIEDVIANISRQIPDEEWNKIPNDLSHRLDFYLYGNDEQDGDK